MDDYSDDRECAYHSFLRGVVYIYSDKGVWPYRMIPLPRWVWSNCIRYQIVLVFVARFFSGLVKGLWRNRMPIRTIHPSIGLA